MQRSLKPYAALVFAAASWGVATTVAKVAVRGIGPFTTLAIETFAASVVLWGFKLWRKDMKRVPLRPLIALGLLEPVLAFGALNLGLQWTDASQAALLDGLQTVIVLILAVIFTHERPSSRAVVCAAIATSGAVLLVADHLTLRVGLGSVLVLCGSLGSSASVLVVSGLSDDVSVLDMTAYPFLVGFILSVPTAAIALLTHTEMAPSLNHWPAMCAALALGLFAFAAAYMAYNFAVARVSVGIAGAALSLIPLFGAVSGVMFLGDRFTIITVIAAVLIIVGVVLFPPDRDERTDPEKSIPAQAETVVLPD